MSLYRSKTEDGVNFMSWGILFIVVIEIIGFIVGLVAASYLMGIFSRGYATDGQLSALNALSTAGCNFIAVSIIAFIFLLLGVYYIHAGQYEFGPEHSKNVGMSLVFMIIAVVMLCASGLISLSFPLFSGTGGGMDWINPAPGAISGMDENISAPLLTSSVTDIIFQMLAFTFAALFFIYPVRSLAKDRDGRLLNAGLCLVIAGAIAGAVLRLYFVTRFSALPDMSSESALTIENAAGSFASIGSIISAAGFILIFIVYRNTLARFARDELKPELPPQFPVFYPRQYAMYPQMGTMPAYVIQPPMAQVFPQPARQTPAAQPPATQPEAKAQEPQDAKTAGPATGNNAYCGQCGASSPVSNKYCPHCGAKKL